MKKILFLLSVVFLMGIGSPQAQAHRPVRIGVNANFYHYPVNTGLWAGWGWYPYAYNWNYPVYGYSYWPYWNYQPYYASFGAVAYSPSNGTFGASWVSDSRSGAIDSAISYCGGGDCKAVVWVQGGCAAVAQSTETKKIGWGYATEKYLAKSNAMRACKHGKTEGCKAAAWVCSY